MSAQQKALVHGILNVVANAGILAVIPNEYKVWILLVWNVGQVIWAFFDPSYAFQKLGKGK